MFDHIQLKVKDLNLSKRFYTAAVPPENLIRDDARVGIW